MSRNYESNLVDVLLESGAGDAFEDVDAILETVDDFGALLRDCLAYLGHRGNFLYDAEDLLVDMVSAIYDDYGPEFWESRD